MSSKDKGTLIMVTVLAASGILWMVKAMLIPTKMQMDLLGPRFFPFWAGASVTFIGLVLIAQIVARGRWAGGGSREEDEARGGARKDDEPKVQYWRTCGAVASLLLFILLLEHLHFFINTVIVSVLGLAFGGEPLKPRLLLYALIISGIAYVLFIVLLQVPLPGSRYR